ERSRQAVEVAERFIEREATTQEVDQACAAAEEVMMASLTTDPGPRPRCWWHDKGMQLVGPNPDCGEDYALCYVSDAAAAAAYQVIRFPPSRWGFPTDPLYPMLDA